MRDFEILIPNIILISFSFLHTAFFQINSEGQKVPDFVTSTPGWEEFPEENLVP